MPHRLKISLLVITLISLASAQRAFGQFSTFLEESNISTATAGGSIGLTASAYSVDGIENRRAPGMIQTNANMNFNLFGFSSGINMNYSTDDSQFRQSMNNISFNATWRWLNIQAGDVSARFSEYGLSGATIRGGYVRMDPGNYLLEITGGRSKRAVRPSLESGFRRPAFQQWAGGVKLGYGSTSSSYFHLSTFYARDEKNSITGSNLDIEPRENLTMTPDFQVELFNGRFTIGSQVTASIFTRDLNSSVVSMDEVNIPSFFTTFYSPRTSTRINYAGIADASMNLDLFSLGLGYERIQPGFESLGRGTVRDDQERIKISPTLRLMNNRINISSNIALGRDNLLGNRVQTQRNTNVNSNVQFVISQDFSLNTTYGLVLNNITAEEIDGQTSGSSQSQISHNVMVQPSLTLRGEEITHNISLTGGYMSIESRFDNQGGMPADNYGSESITSALNYAITLPIGLTLNSSVNYMTNSSDGIEIQNFGFNLGTSYAFFNRSLNVSANAGMNRNINERIGPGDQLTETNIQQLTGSLNSSYNLTDKDSFDITLRTRSNSVLTGAGREFAELEGSFRYQRRF
ncbi:hypothetical protein [Rhodohalobacter barkolensis]|uniref:hypothetical protein n=1 Tax=Rhodohalobacter barkolensis TaxID=2053187 RepID=UPI0010563CFB|nr:hypothetical protein [Rhodohalobacter barkolensis]